MILPLRDYQDLARDALRCAYAAGARAPLLVMPTGAGKTVVFAHVADGACRRGKRTLILVHRRELLLQASRTLESLGVEHGLIAPGCSWRPQMVQVASVQTLARRLGRLGDPGRPWHPDLIVIDEAHHVTAASGWGRVLAHWGVGIKPAPGAAPGAMALGVTATPERLDGQGLGVTCGGVFDALIEGPTVAVLVQRGYLARPVVFAPAAPDLQGVKTRGGDWVAGDLAARVDVPTVTGDAVEHYRRLVQGAPALVFCATVAHAVRVAEEFGAAGFRSASLDGTMTDAERRARISDLGAGRLQVMTSCEIVSEGTDIPVVSAAILLRPTQSLGLYLQQVGRALRLYPGKERALILDHVGNVHRHGLPDEERVWSLEAPKRSARAKPPQDPKQENRWVCEGCGAQHRPAPRCPVCGFVYRIQDSLEFRDGELVEVDPQALLRRRKVQERQARTLADFEVIGEARGYRPGWAMHRWEARQKGAADWARRQGYAT